MILLYAVVLVFGFCAGWAAHFMYGMDYCKPIEEVD